MRKGEKTKQHILQQTAELFNQQGYNGSSLSDVMQATGLQKGGIYNHFESKDQLALETFDFAWGMVSQRFTQVMEGRNSPVEKLLGMLVFFRGYCDDPVLPGGCPVMNTAIESDDTHPALLERAQGAMDQWRRFVVRNVNRAIAAGEFRPDVDPEKVATVMMSMLEGATMISRLYDDEVHMFRVIEFLTAYIENELML